MNIDQRIRASLQRYARTIEPPPELDDAVAEHSKNRLSGRRRSLRLPSGRFAAAVLAAAIALPTAAFASPDLADRIYGSFGALKKKP